MVDNKFVESGTVESVVLPLPYFPSRYPGKHPRLYIFLFIPPS